MRTASRETGTLFLFDYGTIRHEQFALNILNPRLAFALQNSGGNIMTNLAKILSRAALAALAVGMASSAMAATITYTLTGTASARIGNTSENGAFVATGIGDTSNLGFPFSPNTPTVTLSSFTVAFGSNVYTATGAMRFFDNQGNGISGFNDILAADVLDFQSAAFTSYNAISNIGPLPVAFTFTNTIATTAGALNFTSNPSNLVFSAVTGAVQAVPEPATWAMMLAGFGIVGGAMRRRQRVTVTYA